MKREEKGNVVLKAAGKFVQHEAKKVYRGWPPVCGGFIHQPKRPAKR